MKHNNSRVGVIQFEFPQITITRVYKVTAYHIDALEPLTSEVIKKTWPNGKVDIEFDWSECNKAWSSLMPGEQAFVVDDILSQFNEENL